ncbi:MAG: type I methionyl aminopeptidase, partial [Archangium sp.]|nr:type I methionyl aminopeptidase [Archangium sp.]
IPSRDEVLQPGDIINVDITSNIGGFHGDTSATFTVGPVSPRAQRLVDTTKKCLAAGIAAVRHGAHLGDIGAAIQALAEAAGYSVVEAYAGHGIGREMHLSPSIPHTGRAGTGRVLKEGMTFTIEPMINEGSPNVRHLDDEWTVVTADGMLSAQFEHTVLVTRDGCEVLTAAPLADDA